MVRPARTMAHPGGDKVLLTAWILLVVAVGAFAATSAWLLMTPLIAGYLLSVLFSPVCEAMDRRGINRTFDTAAILITVIAFLAFALVWATPLVFAQIQEFQANSEAYLHQASLRLSGLLEFLQRLVPPRELDQARAFAASRLKRRAAPSSPSRIFSTCFPSWRRWCCPWSWPSSCWPGVRRSANPSWP
ncbi:MAG TPA: AI-2E family transporter [Fibrobacteria bacterium]|nr:AI-2E family transporter [Fibrobacteria bacterium]